MSTKLKASLIIIEAIYVLVYSAFLVGYVHNWGALVFFMFTGALAGVMILAIIITKVSQKKQRIRLENRNMAGADVKIMDRLFWHREVPHSENFSKPGFQLKTA